MSILCNLTSDCDPDGIARTCYEENDFREEVFFCDCSNSHGWQGKSCDIPSVTTYYLRVTESIILIWALFLVFTSGKTLFLYSKEKLGKESFSKMNPVFFVA